MFGYFALGVFLGLLIGALIAAILILVVIKCCDKGKMAPYYTVSPERSVGKHAFEQLETITLGHYFYWKCFEVVYMKVSNQSLRNCVCLMVDINS